MKRVVFLIEVSMIVFMASQCLAQVFDLGSFEVYGRYIDILEEEPSSCSIIFPSRYEGEYKDIGDLLSKVPGVRVTRLGGRGAFTVVSIRGSTAGQVAVYLNGVLMNMGGEGAVDLSTIPLDAVERIEVYRGSVPSRFGVAGIGGVINIVTYKEVTFNSVKASLGSFRSYGVESINGLKGGLISLNFETSKGDYPYHNDNNTPYNPHDDYETRRKNNSYRLSDIKVTKKLGDDGKLFLNYFSKHRELPKPAPGSDKADDFSRSNLSENRLLVGFDKGFNCSKRVTGNLFLYGLLWEREFRNPYGDIGWEGQRFNWYDSYKVGSRFSLNYLVGDGNLLELYFDLSLEGLRPGGDIVSQGSWSPLKGIKGYERFMSSLSLDYTLEMGKVIVVPWLRFLSLNESAKKLDDTKTSSSADLFSYGVRVKYPLSNALELRTTWGRFNRIPTFYEKFGDGAFILPNPGLTYEESENFDIGLVYKGKGFLASLTYFRSKVDNLIEFVMSNPKFGYYKNIEGASIEGIELEVSKFWDNGWSLGLSYTYMSSESRVPGYREGKPLPNRPEHSVGLRLERSWKGWGFFVEGEFVGENFFDTGGLVKFSDWWNVSCGVSYVLSSKERISLVVKNITDNQSLRIKPAVGFGPERMADYPPMGRSFYLTYIKNY